MIDLSDDGGAPVIIQRAASRTPEPTARRKYLILGVMAFGQFMALLDIQIVAASLNDIQAGLPAGPDEISWVPTAYLKAELVMIPFLRVSCIGSFEPMAVRLISGSVHSLQRPLRGRLGYPLNRHFPRAPRFQRRCHGADRFCNRLHDIHRASAGHDPRNPCDRCYACANARTHCRRVDYRPFGLALDFLHQCPGRYHYSRVLDNTGWKPTARTSQGSATSTGLIWWPWRYALAASNMFWRRAEARLVR